MNLKTEGGITVWARHEHADWAISGAGYMFPPVIGEGVAVKATKLPDKTVEIDLTGPFDRTFTFRWPIPPSDERGVSLALTWKDRVVHLYLNGLDVEVQKVPQPATAGPAPGGEATPEVRHRQETPSPGVLYSEAHLPGGLATGTGTYRFRTMENAFSPPKPVQPKAITLSALHRPHFRLGVTINPGTRHIAVLLGRADGSDPVSGATFPLPPGLDVTKPHDFGVGFEDWEVKGLTMDGRPL